MDGSDIGGTLANIGGRVLGGVLAAGDINQGGFLNYLAKRNQLLQDPGFRSSAGPFSAGLLEIGGRSVPSSQPGALQAAGMTPEQAAQMGVQVLGPSQTFGGGPPPSGGRFVPRFPPLNPQAALEQQLLGGAQRGVAAMTPEQLSQAGLSMIGIKPAISPGELAQLRGLAGPGVSISAPLPGGATVRFGQPASRMGVYPYTEDGRAFAHAEADWRNSVGQPAAVVEDANSGTIHVITAPRQPAQGGAIDIGKLFGPQAAPVPQPTAPPPAPTGAPPGAAAPSPAPQPAMPPLPKGFVPPEGLDENAPLDDRTVGYPSPAFLDQPTAAPTPPPVAQPVAPAARPQTALGALGAQMPPRSSLTIGPQGVKGITIRGPSGGKEDFSTAAAEKSVRILTEAKGAITRLRQQGILTDNPVSSMFGYNRAQLEYAARTSQDPQTRRDATFLLRNLASTVPSLARGFGEQRTNIQEEQRLRDALSFNFVPASMAEAVIDNYIGLFTQGQGAAQAPAGAPPAPQQGRVLGFRPQ